MEHLADNVDAAHPRTGESLHISQTEPGPFHPLAGLLCPLEEELFPVEKAEDIIAGQEVLQPAHRCLLFPGTDSPQTLHAPVEKLWGGEHDRRSGNRRRQQGPVEGEQCGDAEYYGDGGADTVEKRIPGQTLDLADVIGEQGQIIPHGLSVELQIAFPQQRLGDILADGIVHAAYPPASQPGLQAAQSMDQEPDSHQKQHPEQEPIHVSVDDALK